jgi:hypothetical protein
MSDRVPQALTSAAAVVLGAALLFVSSVSAQTPQRGQQAPAVPKWSGPPCDSCEALPALEEQLFQQEFLKREFEKYGNKEKFPVPPDGYTRVTKTPQGLVVSGTATEYMVEQITSSFQSYLDSPAGGGSEGVAQAELGTDTDTCGLVLYVKGPDGKNVKGKDGKPVTQPFDEKKYREQLNCDPIADFVLAHERQHISDCSGESLGAVGAARGAGIQPGDWSGFATYDARGYEAGIRNLRDAIAKLASECGWQGSTTPETERGKTVPTPEQAQNLTQNKRAVPTAEQIKSVAGALKGVRK